MHELPITENILNIALKYGEKAEAVRITDLYLIIGQLSSVVDDSIKFYWEIISKGTICSGANLHFERIPALFNCLDCGHSYGLTAELSACPNCDSIKIDVIAGEEFQLKSIEIETGKAEEEAL